MSWRRGGFFLTEKTLVWSRLSFRLKGTLTPNKSGRQSLTSMTWEAIDRGDVGIAPWDLKCPKIYPNPPVSLLESLFCSFADLAGNVADAIPTASVISLKLTVQ